MEGGVPGGVEDGPVPAEAHQQVGPGQLLLQLVEGEVPGQVQPVPLLRNEGETQHRIRPRLPQNPVGLQGGAQSLVPVWIGA